MNRYIDGIGIVEVPADEESALLAQWNEENSLEARLYRARASATLTRREFFLGLDAMGIYDTVMNAVLPRTARIELDAATSFERTWPTLVAMAIEMGFTAEQLDALFNIEVTP